ncbi:hypothetical protein [Salinicola peritrichatus]|uniref:hypothetical protein n=1 Tax=Salinicola peritrichatus TaxID=1267424 RepID=UPI0013A6285E|nr:hypothetical protein [Salinicola peritrichatus]
MAVSPALPPPSCRRATQAATRTLLRYPLLVTVALGLTLLYSVMIDVNRDVMWWAFPPFAFYLQMWATALTRLGRGPSRRAGDDILGLGQMLLLWAAWGALLILIIAIIVGIIALIDPSGLAGVGEPPMPYQPRIESDLAPILIDEPAPWHEAHCLMLLAMALALVACRWSLLAGYLVLTSRQSLSGVIKRCWLGSQATVSGILPAMAVAIPIAVLAMLSLASPSLSILSLAASPLLAFFAAFAFALGDALYSDPEITERAP